jgi:hypothetical protein
MPVEKISKDFTMDSDDWIVVESGKDPKTIDL